MLAFDQQPQQQEPGLSIQQAAPSMPQSDVSPSSIVEMLHMSQMHQHPKLAFPSNTTDNPEQRNMPLSKRRRRNRAKKTVQFADEALLYSGDVTEEEAKSMWYNRVELDVFKREKKEIIKLLKMVGFRLESIEAYTDHCLRGYEAYFSIDFNKTLKYARETVFLVVFEEQKRQRSAGIFDPEAMKEVSCNASRWARNVAGNIGRKDAEESFANNVRAFDDALHNHDQLITSKISSLRMTHVSHCALQNPTHSSIERSSIDRDEGAQATVASK